MASFRVIPVPQPKLGHDWALVPANDQWTKLLSITAVMVTGADDGAEYPVLCTADSSGNVMSQDFTLSYPNIPGPVFYCWRSGPAHYGQDTDLTYFMGSAPDFWLPPSSRVYVSTVNLIGDEQWESIVVTCLVDDNPYDDSAGTVARSPEPVMKPIVLGQGTQPGRA